MGWSGPRATLVRWRRGEDGITLVELLFALIILGVILAGLAATLLTSLRAAVTNEHEVRATSLASQALEELQSVEWGQAAMYEDDVSDADSTWLARVDDSTGKYAGEEHVIIPGPGSFDRAPQVPELTSTSVQGGVTYRVDRYVFWVDRDGDGVEETKRFAADVTWESRGRPRAISLASERIPTEGEAASTVTGTRVLQFWLSPNPAQLHGVDDGGELNTNVNELRYVVRLNQPVTLGEIAFYALDASGDPVLIEESMDGLLADPESAGAHLRWEYVIDAGSLAFSPGLTQARFRAFDLDGNPLESFLAVRYVGGEGDPLPEPPSQNPDSGFPAPGGGDDDGGGGDDGGGDGGGSVSIVDATSADPICVQNNSWSVIDQPYVVNVETVGLDDLDEVTITYTYVSNKQGQNATYSTNPSAGMNFVSGDSTGAVWSFDVPGNHLFKPGDTLDFDIDARKGGDSTANAGATHSVAVSSGGGC